MKCAVSVICLLLISSILAGAQSANVVDQHVNPEPGTLAQRGDGRYTFDADILDVSTHGFDPGQGTILYACISRNGYSDMLETLCDWENPSDGTHSCSGEFTFNLGDYTGEFDLYFKTRFYWSGPSVWLDESDHIDYTIQGDPDPALSLSLFDLDFGEAYTSKSFDVWNSGGGTLTYEISESASWITNVSPSSGSSTGEHDTITVTVSRSGLDADTYTEFITVTPSHGINKSVEIEMVVPEDDPALCKSTGSLSFGSSSTSKTFKVSNCGEGTLTYSISDNKSWITDVSPSSGSSTGEQDTITVTVNRSSLSPGTHNGTVTIDPSHGSNQTVSVSVTVADPAPDLRCTTNSIGFATNLSSKTFYISNDGGGTLEYSISVDQDWISVSPASGSSTGERDRLTVSIRRDGLGGGTHAGTIAIESNAGSHEIQVSVGVENHAPAVPQLIAPEYQEVTTIRPLFRWSCTDPDGDALHYDIFLSTSQSGLRAATNAVYLQQPQDTPTAIVALGLEATQWVPPTDLSPYTTYYWSVKARDGSDLTSSAGWRFTTTRNALPDLGAADLDALVAATIAHFALLPDNVDEEITLLQFLDRWIEELEQGAFNADVTITIAELALTVASAGQTHAVLKGGTLAAGFVRKEIAKGVVLSLSGASAHHLVASFYEGQLDAAYKLRTLVTEGRVPNILGYYAAGNSQAPVETMSWLHSQYASYAADCPGNPAYSVAFTLEALLTNSGRVLCDVFTLYADTHNQGLADLLGLRGSWLSKLDWEAGQAAGIELLQRLREIAEEEKREAGCY